MPATCQALFRPLEVSAANKAEGNPAGTEPYSAERRESIKLYVGKCYKERKASWSGLGGSQRGLAADSQSEGFVVTRSVCWDGLGV